MTLTYLIVLLSTRPAVPYILDETGNKFLQGGHYTFHPGKDEVVRDGSDGFIVAFGDTFYRSIDAAETLKEQGYKVGVLNKPTLNLVDEEALKKIAGSGFVLVAETQNQVTGLGSRLVNLDAGTWVYAAVQTFGHCQAGRRWRIRTSWIPWS